MNFQFDILETELLSLKYNLFADLLPDLSGKFEDSKSQVHLDPEDLMIWAGVCSYLLQMVSNGASSLAEAFFLRLASCTWGQRWPPQTPIRFQH